MNIKKFKTRNSITTTYDGHASSFWLGSQFDIHQESSRSFDLTKMAAAQRAIGNFVNIVTGKQIPVLFKGQESYTDGKQVVIGTKIEGKNFDPAVGLALHEGSHIAMTNFDILKNFHREIAYRGCDSDLDITSEQIDIIKNLFNWIEDRRIDYASYMSAPGYRKYYESMYDKYFNAGIIDKALELGEKNEESWDCYLFHIINFTNPKRNLSTLEKLKEVWDIVQLSNIQRLKSSADALDVSCEIYKLLKSHLDVVQDSQCSCNDGNSDSGNEEPANQSGDSGRQKAEGEDSDDTGENKHEADGQQEANQQGNSRGKTPSGLSSAQQKKLEKQFQKQRDFIDGQPNLDGRKISKKDAETLKAIRESGTEVVNVPSSPNSSTKDIETIVIRKLTRSIIDQFDYELFDTRESAYVQNQANINEGIILGKQLGRKLQVRNEERSLKSTRLKTGKIDRRLISQLGYNVDNVFHRVVTDRYKNYFIHISIDASGSMNGEKLRSAIKSAVAIAQAASMTTGIRVQISLRGTSAIGGGKAPDRITTVYAYDSATDSMLKIKTLFKYLKTFGITPEGLAFKSIESYMLNDAKQEECIFLNYSDGMPSNLASSCPFAYTKSVMRKFRNHGFKIISFFITRKGEYQYDNIIQKFKYMYGQDADYTDPTKVINIAKSLNSKFLEQKVNA